MDFFYYRKYLNSNLNKRLIDLLPIEISIYGSDKLVTKFEELTFQKRVEDIEKYLGIDLKTKNFDWLVQTFQPITLINRRVNFVFPYKHF